MFLAVLLAATLPLAVPSPSGPAAGAVDATVRPLMEKHGIPGMAVGVIDAGKPYFFYYGVASKQTMQPVGPNTLFEIGSISKTFTAALASYAAVRGFISLSDPVEKYLPELQGSPFGAVTLLELGTHTAGILPLQVPGGVDTDDELFAYLKGWHSDKAPGTVRVYNNVGIGTLGLIVAGAMHEDFAALMDRRLFPQLGLRSTFVVVPPEKMAEYAQGYRSGGEPVRMKPGELWEQAYGVRTTGPDLVRWLQANLGDLDLENSFDRAIARTHTGYFQAGVMTQDLIWEQYPYPVTLAELLDGTDMVEGVAAARELTPPLAPGGDVWINKTGSTNGFAAYVAFVPAKHLGIVLLANKSYPLDERVTAAYEILSHL